MSNDLGDLSNVRIQILILVAALVVISARLFPKLQNSLPQAVKISNHILVGLGVFALLLYVNFHPFSPKPHLHDLFHYQIGSKYFPELGYTRLYACTAKAEAERDDPSARMEAYNSYIRDLSTGENKGLVSARPYLSDDAFCKSHFSASRWNAFKSDIGFFHARSGINAWNKMQRDHGFNAPPVWMLMGGLISNMIPLSDSALMGVTLIDIALLFGSVACLAWAFGLPTTAFAVIVGTVSMESWMLVGGGMLRFDWLFMAILSVCAMKRGYYVLAGAALGYAAMLRIFPAVFALGPFVGLLYAIYKQRYDLKVAYGKFFGGVVVSVAVLMASSVSVYGVAAYKEFTGNTHRMSNIFNVNAVGLKTVLTYAYDASGYDASVRGGDNNSHEALIEARKKVVPIYVVMVAIALLFFIPAAVSCEPWQAIALGALFTPFMWNELSNYYYLLLIIWATLFAANWKVAFPLLGIGIATKIAWVSGMINLPFYFFMFSAAVCIAALVIWWQINPRPLFWRQALSRINTRKT